MSRTFTCTIHELTPEEQQVPPGTSQPWMITMFIPETDTQQGYSTTFQVGNQLIAKCFETAFNNLTEEQRANVFTEGYTE